jgi:hypothetical protein
MASKKTTKKKTADVGKPMAKSEVNKELATRAGLEPKQVASVLEALRDLVRKQLGKKGPGLFVLPKLIKLKRVKVPARKAGTKPNPFKPGEMMDVKARPAGIKVKTVVLKGLKDVASGPA